MYSYKNFIVIILCNINNLYIHTRFIFHFFITLQNKINNIKVLRAYNYYINSINGYGISITLFAVISTYTTTINNTYIIDIKYL